MPNTIAHLRAKIHEIYLAGPNMNADGWVNLKSVAAVFGRHAWVLLFDQVFGLAFLLHYQLALQLSVTSSLES